MSSTSTSTTTPSSSSSNNNSTPFPKFIEIPPHLNINTPLGVLTQQLLLLIELVTSRVFYDAIPLVGGPDAEQELNHWKLKMMKDLSELNDTNTSSEIIERQEPLPISGYLTATLAALGAGNTAVAHISKSAADSTKAIYEISKFYEKYGEKLNECSKIVRTKDLSDMEKLDTLVSFIDAIWEDSKNRVISNAKACPDALHAVIGDFSQAFFHLENITKGANFLKILEEGSSNTNKEKKPSSS